LPRLAAGQEIPASRCAAGSRIGPASIPDRGVVCYGEHKGNRVLG